MNKFFLKIKYIQPILFLQIIPNLLKIPYCNCNGIANV